MGAASEEGDSVPRGDEDPRGVEVGEFGEVRPDVAGGPAQDGSLRGLSVEDAARPSVVHVGPERRHNPPVPGDRKGYRCELGNLSQERYKAIVVNLLNRYSTNRPNK